MDPLPLLDLVSLLLLPELGMCPALELLLILLGHLVTCLSSPIADVGGKSGGNLSGGGSFCRVMESFWMGECRLHFVALWGELSIVCSFIVAFAGFLC